MKKDTLKTIALGLVIPVVVIAAWWYVTTYGSTPESILPKISTVLSTLRQITADKTLQKDLGISLVRVMEGYIIAAVLGITLGTLMGMSDTIKKIFYPTVTTVRQIPIMAWIPLLILWCGIGEKSKIVVIVIAAFFPVMVNTLTGISSTPQSYIEVARLYKLSRFKTFLRVYLPHALPNIQTGLKLGLGVSWMAVVAAELIASTSGIGYKMSYARTLMRSDIVIICMIVIGIVGILMDKILTVVFNALSPWEKKAHK
jgi:sulfonate transport system permease protein